MNHATIKLTSECLFIAVCSCGTTGKPTTEIRRVTKDLLKFENFHARYPQAA